MISPVKIREVITNQYELEYFKQLRAGNIAIEIIYIAC
jgi:hypothetical protein